MTPYTEKFDLSELQPSFDHLPVDEYTEGGYRFRRQSLVKVYHEHDGPRFIHYAGKLRQSSEINGFLGDVDREYPAIDAYTFQNPTFYKMLCKFREISGWEGDFDVHQIRIKANDYVTPVAPEGPHSDGNIHTMIFYVGRSNVMGGVFEVYGDNNTLLRVAEGNTIAVFDDTKHLHYASPIEIVNLDRPGYWDTFVITAGQP